MDDNRLAKIAEGGKPNSSRPPRRWCVDLHRKTDTLDKIQGMVLQEDEEEGKRTRVRPVTT